MANPNAGPLHNAASNPYGMTQAQQAGHAVGNGVFPGQAPRAGRPTRPATAAASTCTSTSPTRAPHRKPRRPAGRERAGRQGHPRRGLHVQRRHPRFLRAPPQGSPQPGRHTLHGRRPARGPPPQNLAVAGRMHGARARARRVTRYLKLIAAGEKAIAKWSTALYSAFEREFEAELIKIGKGRTQPRTDQRFNWR